MQVVLLFIIIYNLTLCVEAFSNLGILSANISRILDTLLHDYDKRLRPNYGNNATKVQVTVHVATITSVSEVEMDYTLEVYLRQWWIDPRLAFDGADQSLTVGIEMMDSIWIPDTFFPNEKNAFLHQTTTSNSFLRITPSGQILSSRRLTLTMNCPMSLEYFPMDRQKCFLEIESYGYSTKDIMYCWRNGVADSVTISRSDINLAQFTLIGDPKVFEREIELSTGNYSRLTMSFLFERNIGFYLIQIYLPSSLIVIISWVSFWLNREATQARVAIGVTTVLTITTLMTSTNASLPKVSYVKSIDVYLGTCFIIVFASLLEYAAVGYLLKRSRELHSSGAHTGAIHHNIIHPGDSDGYSLPFRYRNKVGNWNYYSLPPAPPPPPSILKRQRHKARIRNGTTEHTQQGSCIEQLVQSDTSSATVVTSSPKLSEDRSNLSGQHTTYVLEETLEPKRECSPFVAQASNDRNEFSCLQTCCLCCFVKPSLIDKYSRVLFPLSFLLFHVIYWNFYLRTYQRMSFIKPEYE